MNKIILAIMVCSMAINSYGQSDEVRIGLKAGLNSSNVFDEAGDHFLADDKIGFVAGGFLKVPLGKYLGFQPEFMFAQKGFVAHGNYGLGYYEFTRTTNFFEIPLLLEVKPSKYFSFLIGPQYCYLMKTSDTYRNSTISVTDEERLSNDNFRKNILAFAMGFDVNLDHIVLSGRAGWDIQKNNGDGSSTNPRYKNNWLQFTVGYLF
jgi:hypothetical protein